MLRGKFQPLHKMNKSEFEMSGDMKCVYSQFTLDLNQAMYFFITVRGSNISLK